MRLVLLGVALAVAFPAAATPTRLRVTGVFNAPTGAALGVPLAAGDRFRATLVFAPPTGTSPLTPLGGTGTGLSYGGTVAAADIALTTAGGSFTISQRTGFQGSSAVYDNGSVGPVRLDYAGINLTTSIAFGPTVLPSLATDLALGEGVFPFLFGFGRYAPAAPGSPPGTLPSLLTSTALPDYATFFTAPGALFSGNLVFAQQTAGVPGPLPTFSFSTFSLGSLQVTVLPEPGIWALLIAGFGAVGVAARRRRAATPAARL